MRAAAVAFVLIIGAAVVLWYGNTLNSLVLGGLIGGLAALLLSIPITLTLFSYLSRRHDERLKAEAQEEASSAPLRAYRGKPIEVYESDEYELPADDPWEWVEGNSHYQISTNRNLPARLPAARQAQAQPATAHQRVTDYTLARQHTLEAEVQPRSNRPAMQQPAARRSASNPATGGRQTRSLRGIQQTAALKAARMEALQQSTDDSLSPSTPRSSSALPQNQRPPIRQHSAGESAAPSRSGRLAVPDDRKAAYPGADNLPRTGPQQIPSGNDPETDKLAGRYPSTGPIRSQPQTGQMIRQPRIDAQPRDPEHITGSLKRPMVRRAPYLYEDDALREELAQQLDPPSVRRFSLYDQYEDEE
jgi:hypothetical protein